MFSPAKKEDKEFLLEIAELIELLVKVGTTQAIDLAESFGDYYLELQKKISSHDYTQEDKRIEILNNSL